MPTAIKEQQLEVMDTMGCHVVYPYGRLHSEALVGDKLPDPLEKGLTFRVFMYRPNTTTTAAIRLYYAYDWYAKIVLSDGTVTWSYDGSKVKAQNEEFPGKPTFSTGFFSLAIRTNDPNVRGIFNRIETPEKSMKKIAGYKWEYRLEAGECVILSIHLSFDFAEPSVAKQGLNQYYEFPLATLKIGSSAIYTMIFTGGSYNLTLTFYEGSSDEKSITRNINLSISQTFIVYIQNIPKGYLISTNYDNGVNLVLRNKYLDLVPPKFSTNCFILNCVAECGMHTD